MAHVLGVGMSAAARAADVAQSDRDWIAARQRKQQCQRTLAIWKPGVPQPGVNHSFAWSGSMPNTGVLRCTLCGQRSGED